MNSEYMISSWQHQGSHRSTFGCFKRSSAR